MKYQKMFAKAGMSVPKCSSLLVLIGCTRQRLSRFGSGISWTIAFWAIAISCGTVL